MNRLLLIAALAGLCVGGPRALGQEDLSMSSASTESGGLKIKLCSIIVSDQEKALAFYTKILGFVKKDDIPLGEYRWLTVTAPGNTEGTQLVLEPNDHAAARAFQKAIFDDGIPATALFVDNIQAEYERLKGLGVKFTTEPTDMAGFVVAVFDDTCGNLIQIVQE